MFDLSEVVGVGAGSSVVGGLLVKALTFSAKRNVDALDNTLKNLNTAISELRTEMRSIVEELRKDMRQLRDTDIAQAKDIGALQEGQRYLRERIDGQAAFWREEFRRAQAQP